MKKVMIGILILVPIIIVMVVSLVSVFVSTRTHIGVEEVELDTTGIELGLDNKIYDLDDYIKVNVLPTRATDRTYTWSIEDLTCLDDDYAASRAYYLEHKDDEDYSGTVIAPAAILVDDSGKEVASNSTGKLRVNAYCSFYVSVHAETKSARCLVYVVGYEVEKVVLSGVNTVALGESALLDVTYSPIDSIVENTVWSSDNESAVTVDKNGVVTAVGSGTANITMSAKVYGKDEYVTSAAYQITVGVGATRFGTEFSIGASYVGLSSIGVDAGAVTGLVNCTVSGDRLNVTDPSLAATFDTANGRVTLHVVDENAIAIENSSVYNFVEDSSNGYILSVGDTPLSLNAVYAAAGKSGTPAVTWTSSRPAVASVDANGKVTGRASGRTVITATCGSNTATVTIAVENKISALIIDKTTASFAVGLGRETVFASLDYVDEMDGNNHAVKNNSFEIGFQRPGAPTDSAEAAVFYESFNFSVYENGVLSDKAYFEGNKLVFDGTKIAESKTVLTVVVSAKFPKYKSNTAYTTCSFDVQVVKGIAVSKYAELVKASNDKYVTCFDANIKMREGDETPYTGWGEGMIYIEKNLYGNGFMFSAAFRQMVTTTQMIRVTADNVTISNVTIRCNQVAETIDSADEATQLTGYCLSYESWSTRSDRLENQRVEYCVLENGASVIKSYGSDLTVEGCIVRNTAGAAFYIRTNANTDGVEYTNLTVKNCAMSNLVGTAFSFHYSGFSNGANANATEEKAAEHVAAGENTTFTQLGFLDIYNWQEANVLNLIPADELAEYGDLVNSLIRSEMVSNPKFDEMSVTHNGVKYFHLGGISTGITEKTYIEYSFEDKRLQMISSDDVLQSVTLGNAAYVLTYGANGRELPPGKVCIVNDKLIDKLHGIY